MKTLLNTLSNTYRAVRLLSDPRISTALEQQLSLKKAIGSSRGEELGKNSAFFHKHYIVQIMN